MALYYEDFEVGREYLTASRTVSEADVRAFAALSGDANPIHLDRAVAALTPFGEPVAHGALGLAVAAGLVSGLELTRGTLVALVGASWRFLDAVRYGDSVTARLRIATKRETRARDRGLVTFAVELVNQRGEVVQAGELVELVRRRAPLTAG